MLSLDHEKETQEHAIIESRAEPPEIKPLHWKDWSPQGKISISLQALALEILFKSFLATEKDSNGGYDLRYEAKVLKGPKAHDLCLLFEKLPESVQSSLILHDRERTILETNKLRYMQYRYNYEPGLKQGFDFELRDLAKSVFWRATQIYVQTKNDDPAISRIKQSMAADPYWPK